MRATVSRALLLLPECNSFWLHTPRKGFSAGSDEWWTGQEMFRRRNHVSNVQKGCSHFNEKYHSSVTQIVYKVMQISVY